jgi:copper chaperone NosL
MQQFNKVSRGLLIFSGIALLTVLYFPIWSIYLEAPQYPEGLSMSIYVNRIGGDIDIINGLNHYIGMKTIHANDFVEFKILAYCVLFFSALFILTGIIAKKPLFYLLSFLFIAFGVIAMIDFWRWEYDYGHNLSEDAAIKVPGMTYQPPLIGYKQLLNFGAYSFPDIGGYIFIAAGLVIVYILFLQVKKKKLS